MQLFPFDEDLKHREILPYNPIYKEIFQQVEVIVAKELPDIELHHIGSTAVPDLRGKPMIDMLAVTTNDALRELQTKFKKLGFHRREVWTDTDTKPYVCASTIFNKERFNLNIHICHADNPLVQDLPAFAEILNKHPDLRRRYEQAKDKAHAIDPVNSEVYNKAKEAIILEIQNQFIDKSNT